MLERGKGISTIFQKERIGRSFWMGARWETGGQFLDGGSGFLLTVIIILLTNLTNIQFTCSLKDVTLRVIFDLFLVYFILFKIFWILAYFINSLFKRKIV